jgi:predicted metal-dependent hydrolase
LTETWCHDPPPRQLLEGVEEFNRGEYFEQHETLERLWRAETRSVRRLYQGILQIGVAFYHLQRRNYHGVVYMLTRGTACLQPFTPACQGIDVAALIELAASTLRVVEQLGPARLDEFSWQPKPCVRLTEQRPD